MHGIKSDDTRLVDDALSFGKNGLLTDSDEDFREDTRGSIENVDEQLSEELSKELGSEVEICAAELADLLKGLGDCRNWERGEIEAEILSRFAPFIDRVVRVLRKKLHWLDSITEYEVEDFRQTLILDFLEGIRMFETNKVASGNVEEVFKMFIKNRMIWTARRLLKDFLKQRGAVVLMSEMEAKGKAAEDDEEDSARWAWESMLYKHCHEHLITDSHMMESNSEAHLVEQLIASLLTVFEEMMLRLYMHHDVPLHDVSRLVGVSRELVRLHMVSIIKRLEKAVAN